MSDDALHAVKRRLMVEQFNLPTLREHRLSGGAARPAARRTS